LRTQNTLDTFVWLIAQLRDVAPVYLLLGLFPAVALYRRGVQGLLRGLLVLFAAHAGPALVLLMGAALYGHGRTYAWLGLLQVAVVVAGILLVIVTSKPLLGVVPVWAYVLFFAGVAIMNLLAWAVGGMALADDWI
jgi:hypothetical protein